MLYTRLSNNMLVNKLRNDLSSVRVFLNFHIAEKSLIYLRRATFKVYKIYLESKLILKSETLQATIEHYYKKCLFEKKLLSEHQAGR